MIFFYFHFPILTNLTTFYVFNMCISMSLMTNRVGLKLLQNSNKLSLCLNRTEWHPKTLIPFIQDLQRSSLDNLPACPRVGPPPWLALFKIYFDKLCVLFSYAPSDLHLLCNSCHNVDTQAYPVQCGSLLCACSNSVDENPSCKTDIWTFLQSETLLTHVSE